MIDPNRDKMNANGDIDAAAPPAQPGALFADFVEVHNDNEPTVAFHDHEDQGRRNRSKDAKQSTNVDEEDYLYDDAIEGADDQAIEEPIDPDFDPAELLRRAE